MSRLEVIPGEKYGMLEVVRELPAIRIPSGQINRVFECRCDCGELKAVRLVHLRHNRVKSCGCQKKTRNGKSETKIGRLLNAMRYRCSENYFERHIYFDRGISVCDEWLNDFDAFEAWCKANGYKPGLHIDRIDNDKGYSPDNCRFVTPIQNQNNRRDNIFVEVNGATKTLKTALREAGKIHKYTTAYRRIQRGMTFADAVQGL